MRRTAAGLAASLVLVAGCQGQPVSPAPAQTATQSSTFAAAAPSAAAAAATPAAPAAPTPVAAAVQTGPKLFVYRGAGCTGVAALPQFENLVGRKVDGVVDFNDYTSTAANAVSNLNWQLGCWQGHVPQIAISIGLAFQDTTTAQIASGSADSIYQQMGQSLVSHGFPNAVIRLGWEMNGGWYGWGQQAATFGQAFSHIAAILKATPGSNFTIGFNPAAGLDPSTEFPANATGVDQMQQDAYANSWNCGGCTQTEPALWTGDDTGWWGFVSFLNGGSRSWYTNMPSGTAVPEFGVGSRGDGHGACGGTGANDCDDGAFMTQALATFSGAGVAWIGYWDYDAGDYNSMISDASRPNEALALIQAMGSPAIQTFLKGATVAATAPATVVGGTGIYTVALTLSDGSSAMLLWGSTTTSQALTITPNAAASVVSVAQDGATSTLANSTTALAYTYAGGQTVLHFAAPAGA